MNPGAERVAASGLIPLLATLAILSLVAAGPNGRETFAAESPPKSEKLPIPSPEPLEQARQTVKSLFDDSYQKAVRSSLMKTRLADTLLKTGLETTDDPTAAYALFLEAERLAIEGGKVSTALEAAAAIEARYEVDGLSRQLSLLQGLQVSKLSSTNVRDAIAVVNKVASEAAQRDLFAEAHAVAEVGKALAGRLRDAALIASLKHFDAVIGGLEVERAKFEVARAALQSNPQDPDANSVVARYAGLRQHDWEAARRAALLANDTAFASLLARQAEQPVNGADIVALANDWWDFSEGLDEIPQQQARQIAIDGYELVLEDLSGLTKRLIEERIETVRKVAPGTAGALISFPAAARNREKVIYLTNVEEALVETWKGKSPQFGFSKGGKIWIPNATKPDGGYEDIVLGGVKSPHGIVSHPFVNRPSRLVYDISRMKASTFKATVGVCDNKKHGPYTPLTFEVWGDEKLLWKSEPVKPGKWGQRQDCEVGVQNVRSLELRCDCPGDNSLAIAVWCEPRLIFESGGDRK